MSNVTPLSNVQRLLDGVSERRPQIVMIAYYGEERGWTTGIEIDAGGFPLAEMIGMLEVMKAQLLAQHYDDVELTPTSLDEGEGDSDG